MEIITTLLNFIQQNIINEPIDAISIDDDLLDSGIVDSMGMMRLVRFVENTFTIEVPFEDMTHENFMSVKNISDYIATKN